MSRAEEHRRVAAMLAWHAAGTLDETSRRLVDEHVRACDECRGLLDIAARHADLASEAGSDDLLAHVDPLLLVEYADDPESLEPWTREFVEERLAACADCRDALARLRELPPIETPREQTAGARHRLRRALARFAGAALRPQLAAIYLAILVVALPAVLVLRGPDGARGRPAVTVPGSVLRLEPERIVREGASRQPEPVDLGNATSPVLAELLTDLRPEDRGGLDGVRVEVLCAGRTLLAESLALDALPVRDGRLAVPVLIDPSRLDEGTTCEIRARAVAPGRLVDGQVLARRSLVVARSAR
ncbi:MAG: hypothetical protein Kow0062_28520 [Acidobacteriota bacterium]